MDDVPAIACTSQSSRTVQLEISRIYRSVGCSILSLNRRTRDERNTRHNLCDIKLT